MEKRSFIQKERKSTALNQAVRQFVQDDDGTLAKITAKRRENCDFEWRTDSDGGFVNPDRKDDLRVRLFPSEGGADPGTADE